MDSNVHAKLQWIGLNFVSLHKNKDNKDKRETKKK